MHRSLRIIGFWMFASLSVLFFSCASAPAPVPQDASPQKIIQLAQERYDAYDLDGASYYYQVLLERYGSDPNYMLNAKYELAFIEYKRGNKTRRSLHSKKLWHATTSPMPRVFPRRGSCSPRR